MELLTKVNIEQSSRKIDFNSNILLIGSCFSTSIGQMLQSYGFNAQINPFGVLFNPASIANACERLANPRPFEATEVIDISQNRTTNSRLADKKSEDAVNNPNLFCLHKEPNTIICAQSPRFCSFSHHSSFARSTAQEFLDNANASLTQASDFFKKADTLIITLGTAYVFRHIARNTIVSNCHKIVPQEFSRELLSIEQSLECLGRIMKVAEGKHVIFTVSPVRHLADGAHGNQLSKSTLLHAINELKMRTARTAATRLKGQKTAGIAETAGERIEEPSPVENKIDYFPAFEIMMDELRDYRFYAEDMVHPSEVAVKYIFERFTEAAIDPLCKPQMATAHRQWLLRQHHSSM